MKYILLITCLLFSIFNKAQPNVKVYYKQTKSGYNVYADNKEFCPVSIKFDLKLVNLNVVGGKDKIFVAHPQKEKQLLMNLKVLKKGKKHKFSYKYWMNYGNLNKQEYDEDFAYYLPFMKSKSFKIAQGYNGSFSHKNKKALDFDMSIGTEITAIRSGVVIKVIENNYKNCSKKKCKKYNNLIIIYHSDGTFAEYTHIKQQGSKVEVGDKVSKGEMIGWSGNVGWSSGPHLHIVVFQQELNRRKTLATKFRIGNGNKIEPLQEGKEYSKNY